MSDDDDDDDDAVLVCLSVCPVRLEPVSLMINKSRLRWFGHVERKDDNDWVKHYMTWEVEGIRLRGRSKKTWWDCVKGQPATPGSPGKWLLKRSLYVCLVGVV